MESPRRGINIALGDYLSAESPLAGVLRQFPGGLENPENRPQKIGRSVSLDPARTRTYRQEVSAPHWVAFLDRTGEIGIGYSLDPLVMTRDFFDPTPEEQKVVLIDADTLRKAQKLIESCEHGNPEGAEIPFDAILDRVTGSDPSVTDYVLERPGALVGGTAIDLVALNVRP
jgi:hypothetical protein